MEPTSAQLVLQAGFIMDAENQQRVAIENARHAEEMKKLQAIKHEPIRRFGVIVNNPSS